MVYQLPNGKVIFISIEEFLELTEYDIQYLMSIDAGEYISGHSDNPEISRNEYFSDEDEEGIQSYTLEDTMEIPDFIMNDDYTE